MESARAVLQRSVQINNKNPNLWMEYFNFEIEKSKDTDVPAIVFKYAIEEVPHLSKKLLKKAKESRISKELYTQMKKIMKDMENSS